MRACLITAWSSIRNPDAVEEFRILENNYSAEYGRNGGGVITVVSKGGTSQYHGTVFEFNRQPPPSMRMTSLTSGTTSRGQT